MKFLIETPKRVLPKDSHYFLLGPINPFSGPDPHAKEVSHPEPDDSCVADEQPLVQRPALCAEGVPLQGAPRGLIGPNRK